MNSQTAITLLKNLEQSLDDYCELNDEGKTAFSMAITALELFGISEQLPSVHPELSSNSPELDNKNGELISRQKAIDAISKKQGGVFDQDAEIDTAVLYVYSECKAIIKDLPSVQPKIIRCKDCKHWEIHKRLDIPWCRCLHSDMGADDYCSYAELRGDSDG